MKFHAICVVKNEADIIKHTLISASAWCDYIYVLDNGSDDDTWNIINKLSQQYSHIIPWKTIKCPFNNILRANVFNEFQENSNYGDWWCRLDSDEIYLDCPRDFVQNFVNKNNEVIWSVHIQFYFTDVDLKKYQENPELYGPDIPPEKRFHYYVANASEARFFKYRPGLKWEYGAWPKHMGRVCKKRIRLKHYQYRSPLQMQKRIDDRKLAKYRGCDSFSHVNQDNWNQAIRLAKDLCFDNGDNEFVIDEYKLPKHLESIPHRSIKHFMHILKIWP